MQLKILISVFVIALITSGFTTLIILKFLNKPDSAVGERAFKKEQTNVIKAKEFQVVDESGKERIILNFSDIGPRIALLDSDGNTGAQLLLTENDMPAFILGASEEDETGKIVMLVEDKERPAFLITDKTGQTKVAMKVEVDNLPQLILAGEMNEMSHEPQAILFFKDGVIPKLKFTDSNYDILWESP